MGGKPAIECPRGVSIREFRHEQRIQIAFSYRGTECRELLPLCTRSGVRYRNPYQVRHTYASAMLTAGTNPWYVAQQLGHVDVQMVFRTYGKFIPADYQKPKAPKLRAVS